MQRYIMWTGDEDLPDAELFDPTQNPLLFSKLDPYKAPELGIARVKIRIKSPTFVYFTDAHNQPKIDQRRFEWLAKYVNEVRPNYLIDGGDFDDFESLCGHVGNDSYQGRFKPLVEADLAHSRQARAILDAGIKCNPQKHVTLGNHEYRIWSFEDRNPEMFGMIQAEYMQILNQFGWTCTPYKKFLTLEGIDFTHIPMTGNGKQALGGENITKKVADKTAVDTVFGHTHTMSMYIKGFINERSVKTFNGGCFMPSGYRADYDKNTCKEYWYGAHKLQSINGRLHIRESITMDELRECYSGLVH